MHWKHLPIVAFDTETTGLDPFAGDRVIEFAAVVLHLGPDGRVTDVERHTSLFNPGIPIPKKATEISGIRDIDVAGKPTFEDKAEWVFELLRGKIAVAHNLAFDLGFLTRELTRAGRHWPEPLAEIDTLDMSMRLFREARSHKLADLCERLGVVLDGAHRAENDAEACGRCFAEMARRFEVEDELQAMLDWADAIGRPPEDGPIGPSDDGRIVFREGNHAGTPVGDWPLHLAWLTNARLFHDGEWRWRYPESTRTWAQRWLRVRASGRARQSPKSFHAADWVLDSCIASERRRGP